MLDTARVNASILQAMGRDDVSLRGTGYDITLRGVFASAWQGTAMGGMHIDRTEPTLQVLTSDLSSLGGADPKPGDQAEIGTTIYTIVSAKETDGLTEMVLRLYV